MDKKEPVITAWVTKWALTQGILKVRAEVCLSTDPSGDMISWCTRNDFTWRDYAHKKGRDWHRTAEAAVARAEAMRKKRIASLRKVIAKLDEKKSWPVTEVGPQ